jgi:hypothetical protein
VRPNGAIASARRTGLVPRMSSGTTVRDWWSGYDTTNRSALRADRKTDRGRNTQTRRLRSGGRHARTKVRTEGYNPVRSLGRWDEDLRNLTVLDRDMIGLLLPRHMVLAARALRRSR